MKLNLKPSLAKIVCTILVFYCFGFMFDYYSLLFTPLFYILASIEKDKESEIKRWNIVLNYFLISILMTMALLAIVSYPNPSTFLKSTYQQNLGYEKLAEDYDYRVVDLAAKVYNLPPYEISNYLYRNFEAKTDFECWGAYGFPETPAQFLDKGSCDCESFSIMTKAITNILEKSEDYKKKHELKELNVNFGKQPIHSYLVINNEDINYIPELEEYTFWDYVKEEYYYFPRLNRIIFFVFLSLIWFRGLFKFNGKRIN